MGKYILVFLIVFIALFSVYNFQVDISSEVNNKNSQYSRYLSAATHDAAKVIKDSANSSGNVTALSTNEVRKSVTDTFFNSLAMDFGYTSNEDLTKLHIYVPVLALIDTDGYYICYNEEHSDGSVVTLGSMITAENTWTKNTGHYLIRYYLGNNVDVTDLNTTTKTAGMTISGNYRDVYRKLGCPAELFQYGFSSMMNGYELPDGEAMQSAARLYGEATYASEAELADREKGNAENNKYDSLYDYTFNRYKRSIIIRDMQEKIEYYINQHNKVAMDFHVDYKFTMPETTESDWTRMVENPTCIGFLQGVRVSNARDYLNIFAIGGGDISKTSTVTYKESTKRVYTLSDASNATKDPDGYVPGAKSVTKENGEVEYTKTGADGYTEDSVNGDIYYHKHTGDSINGGGCYTVPVYHTHDKTCYEIVEHHHVNNNGDRILITRNMLEPHYNISSLTTGTAVEIAGMPSLTPEENGVSKDVTSSSGVNGCYTTPVYHKHKQDCYEVIRHKHFYYDKNGNIVYPSMDNNYSLLEEVFWDGTLINKNNVASGLSKARKKWIVGSKHYYPDLNYDGEIKGEAEEAYLGCFGGMVQHVHTAQCYADEEVTKTKKVRENIYHEHVEPEYYYVSTTSGGGETGVGISKTFTTDASYKIPESGFYILEAYGVRHEETTGILKGAYAAGKVYLQKDDVIFIKINKKDELGIRGDKSTYVAIESTTTPKDTDDIYLLASGGDKTGVSYATSLLEGWVQDSVNNGAAKVVISQFDKTTNSDIVATDTFKNNTTILWADTTVSKVDGVGNRNKVCYLALYASPAQADLAAQYIAARKVGNTASMQQYLSQISVKYEYRPGYIYLGLSDAVCGMTDKTIIGHQDVVKEYKAKESQLACHEVYLSFALNCGVEAGDIEGRECKCGRSDGTNKDASGNVIPRSIDGWALSCEYQEGEKVQGSLTCTKKTSEDAAVQISELVRTGKTKAEAKQAVIELFKNNGSFEGWDLGCGLQEGQRISKAQWEAAGGH